MSSIPLCSRCGAPLTAKSQGRVCWRCLGHGMLWAEPEQTALSEGPGCLIGRYKLLQQIGEGGCGTVFLAEQEVPMLRRVALKIIKLGMDTKAVIARFEAERQALALMDHPNIAKVLDAGATDSGRPYFVMELVRGIKITDYCDQNHLTTRQRLELFIPVCQAIQHAHQKGIIHRDIKPSNILVTLNDGVPVPKVIDFGIAKATVGKLTDHTLFTAFEQFIGTPAYMSPEQAELTSLDIDTRSDVYSLGILLYELLAGSTPFTTVELLAQGIEAMRKMIREQEPARPSTRLSAMTSAESTTAAQRRATDPVRLAGQLQGDLDWIVLKCLEKDRTRRYETANGLAADLRRHLNDEPVVACPPSTAYQMQKAFRRHRGLALAGGCVAAILLVATLVSGWMAHSENRQRQIAQETSRQLGREKQRADDALAVAQVERQKTLETVIQLELQKSDQLLASDDVPAAWAYLAHAARRDPSNEVAAAKLFNALALGGVNARLCEPSEHEAATGFAEFSPDGRWVVSIATNKLGTRIEARLVHIWDARTGRLQGRPIQHDRQIRVAHFSPDGRRVVTASIDGTARVWDTLTGAAVTPLLKHTDDVASACFSPDGRWVATASGDTTAQVWDAVTGEPVSPPLRHQHTVWCANFSPDGRRLVTASEDGTAQIWDPKTGKPLGGPLRHVRGVRSAEFSPDGNWVVTASVDQTARVWAAETGQPVTGVLQHPFGIGLARFSPDGRRVVTTCSDGTARLWDARSGKPMGEPMRHKGNLWAVEFSPDGRRVLTGAADRTARIWDAESGRPLTGPLRLSEKVSAANFSPDGQRVVIGSGYDRPRILDVRIAVPAFKELLPPVGGAVAALFSPNGREVLTVQGGGEAQLWDAQTGGLFGSPFRHTDQVRSAEFSPDGRRVVIASFDHTAWVWDVRTARVLCGPLQHADCVNHAHFSPDGRWVLTASDDRTARVWDAATGAAVSAAMPHSKLLSAAIFSPDGSRVATGSWDGTARVWDARMGTPLTEPLVHAGWVHDVRFSHDGSRLLTACADGSAWVWDARAGKPLMPPLRHHRQINHVEFSPDDRLVLTASADGTAQVWDAATGRPLTAALNHQGEVGYAQFSPDGQRVVTTSADKTARVWDARTGKPLGEPWIHLGSVNSAQFSPDGRQVVTRADDYTVRIWPAPPIPVLPVPEWVLAGAEAMADQRLDEDGASHPVPFAELVAFRKRLAESAGTDDWTRLGQWLSADPADRADAPFSRLSLPEYVRQRMAENTLESLREAERLAPTNGLVMVGLGRALLAQLQGENPRRFAEAAWYGGRAVQFAAGEVAAWELRGDTLQQVGVWPAAVSAYERSLALVAATPGAADSVRSRILAKKARAMRSPAGWEQAAFELRLARDIPDREPATDQRLVDLSSFYNAGLVGEWNQDGYPGNDLASLPNGLQTFGGTKFDVRGLVQLSGGTNSLHGSTAFPDRVTGIPLGLKGDRVRFLTGVQWGDASALTEIGKFVIYYVDSTVVERLIILGRDALDWRAPIQALALGTDQPVPAWSGPNAYLSMTELGDRKVSLYAITWENPRPETVIASVDFVSALAGPKPFLVGVTVE